MISVLEPAFGNFARQQSLPFFYADSLFWLWANIDHRVSNADIYFIQNFPGVTHKIEQWKKIIKNPVVVGPIVSLDLQMKQKELLSQKDSNLIINFGGLESDLANLENGLIYPFIITKILLPALDSIASDYKGIFFTGNQAVMNRLDQEYPSRASNIYFQHYEHRKFLELLNSCCCLITSPGLTTTYEACLLGVPIRFLPPQNYSQTLMLDYYRKTGLADFSLHWRDLYAEYNVVEGLDETYAVKQILLVIDQFSQDEKKQKLASEILRLLVTSPMNNEIAFRQKEFVKTMGLPSSAMIAKSIDRYLQD
jgi:hypothetical protein